MKQIYKSVLVAIMLFFSTFSQSQVYLENVWGEEIVQNNAGQLQNIVFGNFSLSDKCLKLRTIYVLNKDLPVNFISAGIKIKHYDGSFKKFKLSNHNMLYGFHLSYHHSGLFTSPETNNAITDKLSVIIDNQVSEHLLEKRTSNMNYDSAFNAYEFSFLVRYQLVFEPYHTFSLTTGFEKQDNYKLLNSWTSYTNTYDYMEEFRAGRYGDYHKFNSVPFKAAYTLTPKMKRNFGCGVTVFYANNIEKEMANNDLGVIVSLLKKSKKTGLNFPLLSIGVQYRDIGKSPAIFKLYAQISSTFNLLTY